MGRVAFYGIPDPKCYNGQYNNKQKTPLSENPRFIFVLLSYMQYRLRQPLRSKGWRSLYYTISRERDDLSPTRLKCYVIYDIIKKNLPQWGIIL